jgi:Bifunctional DNA primase/polymerase, N-terminal
MCYDDVAPLYEARGYHPLPVDPKDKFPVYMKADGTYAKAAGWTTEKIPLRGQGKANIGIRTGTDIGIVGVDVDTDDPDIQAALPAIVRDSLVKKKGQRGYTSFLYGPGTRSRKYLINDKTVLEILGVGRQTVIPPSIHPVTQKPYEWVGEGFELLDVEPARDLTHVPADFEKLLEEALRPFGYKDEPERSTAGSDKAGTDDQAPHRQLNDLARANLQRWVPELGLKKHRRKRGPHLAYEAVATWRPSTQGHTLEERAYNLSITSKSGITDFGVDRHYTPLDLVMAARALNLSDAFMWLDDKLEWSAGGPEIVIPGPWEGSDKNARPEEDHPEEDTQRARDDAVLKTAGAWMHGDSLPPAPECSWST